MSQEEEEKETQIDIVGDGSLLDFLLTEFGITNLGEINDIKPFVKKHKKRLDQFGDKKSKEKWIKDIRKWRKTYKTQAALLDAEKDEMAEKEQSTKTHNPLIEGEEPPPEKPIKSDKSKPSTFKEEAEQIRDEQEIEEILEKDSAPKVLEVEEDQPEGADEDDEPLQQDLIQVADIDAKVVSQHRKAYVKWLNEDFYKVVQGLEKAGIRNKKSKDERTLKVYQILVQKYLGIETPFRGLLVYHGLGTGKTATAISLAEGLSSQMRINTLLPASLEGEFLREIQEWGKDELNKENLWKFYNLEDIHDEELKTKYGLSLDAIRKMHNATILALKKEYIQDTSLTPGEIEAKIIDLRKKVKKIQGIWIADKNGAPLDSFKDYEQAFILQQINAFIHLKYNFIHYNPFPKVREGSIEEFLDAGSESSDDEDDLLLDREQRAEIKTNNQKIVRNLEQRLRYNQKHYNINSPFYNEVIIIDEVHNFVREILNPSSKPSKIFYEWIINAENVKLVFLSGTPVINKPCEIAILYNMLKGLIKIYTFTVKSDKTVEEVNQRLTSLLYSSPSLVELFYVEQKQGQLMISFTQEHGEFENLRDEDQDIVYTIQRNKEGLPSFQEFINTIYDALHDIFDPDTIVPLKDTFENLSKKEKTNLLRGEKFTFDKESDILFNKHQRLFDIYDDGRLIDTTNNEEFMAYFFEDTIKIPEQKRVLLKRMLMGLTTYYPIDRTSIVDMPQIVAPVISTEFYKDYTIVKNLNIIPCLMSQTQFEKYSEAWAKEKTLDAFRRMRDATTMYSSDTPYHYHMRTRQSCNMIYIEDEFRTLKVKEDNKAELEAMKIKVYESLLSSADLSLTKNLKILSPKMFQIMHHIQKFMQDGKPTGKILFYSDFRADAGSEAFELVLQSNGYEKFNSKNPQQSKALRYTFITGAESADERSINKKHFNDVENKLGEYIQIILISSAGAEGISLKCVRQVHILDPYWNYVRVDQVLGRAIRMKSHEDLPKEDRNVEQYLYLSILPLGTTYESIYGTLYDDPYKTWEIPSWSRDRVKTELLKSENKQYKELFDSILAINIDSEGLSSDQHLFEIMEKKHKVSLEVNDVIKASSLDCIQHTRDDPELNDRCIRFSDKLIGEIAYFPGISASVLDNIDLIQLKAKYLYHIKPDIYVISASSDVGNNIFIYYEYSGKRKKEDIDIRYLRENGKRLCDVYLDTEMVLNYVPKEHSFNSQLGSEFSVYQEIYQLPKDIIGSYIDQETFPPLKELITEDVLHGYKLKYNINDTFYFMGVDSILPEKCIQKVYPYVLYEDAQYNVEDIPTRVIYKGDLYIQD